MACVPAVGALSSPERRKVLSEVIVQVWPYCAHMSCWLLFCMKGISLSSHSEYEFVDLNVYLDREMKY